jgi:nucleoside-diphosphate-sugar epimerase
MSVSPINDSGFRVSRVAVLGAGGFVGARLMRVLRGCSQVKGVGIVRSAKSLARLSSHPMEVRVVNTSRTKELAEALSDCDTVVNAVNGDVSQVLRETRTAYEAALAARCKLMIHLSSAVVYGRANSPGLHDDSPPDTRNWMLYARGKAESEVFLRSVMGDAKSMRIVALRPGLIWGPFSQWSGMVGEQLSRGSVCLSNAGRGIANLVHVDNLVQMMLAVHGSHTGPSGFYNVGDPEAVTWSQYYQGLCKRLGYPETHVRTWPDARLPLTPKLALEWCLQRKPLYRVAKWCLPRVGLGVKAAAKKVVKGEPFPPGGLQPEPKSAPRLTREHWALQNTTFRLPMKKFFRDYGPVELESTESALDSTASWLRFAGYAAANGESGPFDSTHIW